MTADSVLTTWEDFVAGETLFTNAIRLNNFIRVIEKYVPVGAKILETGFGSGKTAVMMADMGYYVTAIDVIEVLVERVQSRYAALFDDERLVIRQADMLHLPWNSVTFELAYHQGVLEHFSDDDIVQALTEQARVAPMVIFDIPNHRYGERPFGDERLLRPSHWRRLIRSAGLQVMAEYGRGFKTWHYILPYAIFSKKGLYKWPFISRLLGRSSIFVCKSPDQS